MRIGDIAAQLQLSPVNVARAADRLAARSWVRRMGAAHDRKAVFVEVTEAGAKQQRVIARTVDDLGRKLLWKHLKRPQRDAIRAVTDTVIEGLRERERRKDLAVAENLRPIG